MAKRTYSPKIISPEVARENAISAAKSRVMYAQKDVAAADALIARIMTHGPVAADAVGAEITMGMALAQTDLRTADLVRAEAELASL